MYQAHEGILADKQLGALLELPNLAQRDSSWTKTMQVPDTAFSRVLFARRRNRQMLTKRLAASRLASGLLRAGYCRRDVGWHTMRK